MLLWFGVNVTLQFACTFHIYTESSKVLETEGQRQMMINQEEEGKEEGEEEDVVEEETHSRLKMRQMRQPVGGSLPIWLPLLLID